MRRTLLLLAVLAAGNLGLIGVLRGREYATVWLAHDPQGAAFDAAPGPNRVARAGDVLLNYSIGFKNRVPTPPRTDRDRGLDDVRASITWVRAKLAVGDDYHAETWYLSDALDAAREGEGRFMCDSYSRALVNASLRQGYAARVVLLDGHISSEVFLPAVGRWVFADALYDFIATDPAGEPLSVLEASRRLRSGAPVRWSPVVGDRGDDDDLHPRNLWALEGMLRRGRFRIVDGAMGFGRLTRLDRVKDFVRGRVHMVEHAPAGEPPSDRDERALRAVALGWNVGLLALALVLAVRGRLRPRPDPAPAPA